MKQTVQLTKIWGIPIGFNNTWYLIFALVIWTLATGYIPSAYPDLPVFQYWIIATITSILFFGSVIFHELAHAYFALQQGIPVKQITLFIFGGVAEMEKEAPTPWAEFLIAIAGPISSLVAAGFFFLITLLQDQLPLVAAPASYLMQINFLLAIFNLIPGFPLDGGRVLRAIMWYFTDYAKASRIATFTGQLVAYGFMGFGVFRAFSGDVINGIWLVFIGWFLYSSATSHGRYASIKNAMDGVLVERLMMPNWSTVEANTPVSRLVDDQVVSGNNTRYFFVKHTGYGYDDEPHPHGMLTLTDIHNLNRGAWSTTPIHKIMTGWGELITTNPTTPLTDAIHQMDEQNINQLPVLNNNQLVGVLTREHILHFLHMKTEFKT